ncbi:MAG TPA: sulfatase-like hydrolase/transferase, partial [Pirellulales bacterium]|nr:sulfatase-like hydrolase/transferase [Pirellulales bacterium]
EVTSTIWAWIYMLLMVLLCHDTILGGIGCGLAILAFGRLGLLDSKIRGVVLPYLGSRSYSIYLTHVVVGSNLIRALFLWSPLTKTLGVLLAYFAIAFLATLLVSELLFRLIERRSHRLARRIAWQSAAVVANPADGLAAATLTLPETATVTIESLFPARWMRRWPTVATAIRSESAWLVPIAVFAAIWLLELYVVQSATLAPGHSVGRKFDFFAPKIRFLMDVFFVGACISLLDRRGLTLLAIGSSLVSLILLTYYNYFYRPLSVLHIVQNFREGMELSVFVWDLIDGATLLSLGVVLLVKLMVLRSMPTTRRWRSPAWLAFFGVFAVGYVTLFVVADRLDPLEKIAVDSTFGRLGIIRGYLGPWIGEFYYLNDDRLLQRAVERREYKSDQLTEYEIPLHIEPRLVIIQAESLDGRVIDYFADGKPVTPFLNRLRTSAMYFRVKVFHYQGSCDSDFTMLEGVAATPRVNAYYMPNYPFANSLPGLLKEHGYHVYAFHGNRSSFYNRGWAFHKMGFEQSFFQEKLEHDFGLPVTSFGIADQDVFELSSHLLRESGEPVCHFIISLTSHTPYEFVTPQPDYPYLHPTDMAERYFNSMRYLDDCLNRYMKSLPKHTTVVIYGDHCTEVKTKTFSPDRIDDREFVPCFIYDTDHDLAEEQRTRQEPIAINGELNLLDVASYIRGRVSVAPQALPIAPDVKAPAHAQPLAPQSIEPAPDKAQHKPSTSAAALPAGEPIARRSGGGYPQTPADP